MAGWDERWCWGELWPKNASSSKNGACEALCVYEVNNADSHQFGRPGPFSLQTVAFSWSSSSSIRNETSRSWVWYWRVEVLVLSFSADQCAVRRTTMVNVQLEMNARIEYVINAGLTIRHSFGGLVVSAIDAVEWRPRTKYQYQPSIMLSKLYEKCGT